MSFAAETKVHFGTFFQNVIIGPPRRYKPVNIPPIKGVLVASNEQGQEFGPFPLTVSRPDGESLWSATCKSAEHALATVKDVEGNSVFPVPTNRAYQVIFSDRWYSSRDNRWNIFPGNLDYVVKTPADGGNQMI